MIEAVLFDLDGLLINSEPFWQEAEYSMFQNLGIEITPKIKEITYGLPVKEMIEFYYKIKPWDNFNLNKIKYKIFDEVEKKIIDQGNMLPGVLEIIEYFKKKKLKTGIASASPYGIIYAALDKLKIRDKFDIIHSGDEEEYGKPHPAVYINAAKKLNIKPINCLVFEDSLVGVIAALSARMKVVAIVRNDNGNNAKYAVADLQLNSLADFTKKHFELLNTFH